MDQRPHAGPYCVKEVLTFLNSKIQFSPQKSQPTTATLMEVGKALIDSICGKVIRKRCLEYLVPLFQI